MLAKEFCFSEPTTEARAEKTNLLCLARRRQTTVNASIIAQRSKVFFECKKYKKETTRKHPAPWGWARKIRITLLPFMNHCFLSKIQKKMHSKNEVQYYGEQYYQYRIGTQVYSDIPSFSFRDTFIYLSYNSIQIISFVYIN